MSVMDICGQIVTRLSVIPNIDQVTDQPPPQLPDDRMIIVTPMPGTGTPWTHASEAGHPVIEYRDKIIVEAHHKIAEDQIGAALVWAGPMLDLVRGALWLGWLTDQFGHTVTLLSSITADRFGGLGWGSDPTFGFVLSLDLTHAEEVM